MEQSIKRTFNLLLFAAVFLFILFSCVKENNESKAIEDSTAFVEEIQIAKEWFERHYASGNHIVDSISIHMLKSDHGRKGNKSFKAKLNWGHAKVGKDKVVEIPLKSPGKISYAKGGHATEAQLSSAITRMIIVAGEDGERMAAFMHIVADSSYLVEKGYDLSENSYKDLKNNFSGQVFYTYLDGQFCNGWRYEGGLITATISYDGILTTPDVDTTLVLQSVSDDCTLYTVEEYFQWCYEGWVGEEYMGYWCDPPEFVSSYSFFECPTDGNSGGGGGIEPGGPGGNSNNDNNSPTSYTVTVVASPSNGGIVTGGGSYGAGATCTISAQAANGYVFTGWTGSVSVPSAICSFAVAGNMQFTANFALSNNPCTFVDSIAADGELKNRLAEYKAMADTGSVEYGYSRRANGQTDYATGVQTSISYSRSGKYTERIHTHPMVSGGAPYFSAGDIRSLYRLFNGGNMEDVASFRYGIVTPYGYYLLSITNPDAFRNFGNAYNLNNSIEKLKKQMEQDIEFIGSVNILVSSFIQFINNQHTGLSVIMGRFMDESDNPPIDWKVKDASNNTLIDKNCN